MFGDDQYTLVPACHEQLEAEANFAAGRLLFLRDRFTTQARDYDPGIDAVRELKPLFGNTFTTTFWRCVETWGIDRPIVGLITDHPHRARRPADFDPAKPCRHVIQSQAFADRFACITDRELFEIIVGYCNGGRGGPLGSCEAILTDDYGEKHLFYFESFSFHHNVLTLGLWLKPYASPAAIPRALSA